MNLKVPIVVLASGRGSGFEAIHSAIKEGQLTADILAVISDRSEARVLERAKTLGVPTYLFPFPKSQNGTSLSERRQQHEANLIPLLKQLSPRFLVLAGYMRVLTSRFIEEFRTKEGYTRIVNIHPSLLPAFPGVGAYAQAFRYGVQVAGVTVHLVEAGVDSGPICVQEAFSIEDCTSEKEVEKKGLAVEHRLYPQTLHWLLQENFRLESRGEGRVCVRPN